MVNFMCHLQQVQAAVQAVLLLEHMIPEGYVDIILRHDCQDAVAGGAECGAQTCTLDRTWLVLDGTNMIVHTCLFTLLFDACFSRAYMHTDFIDEKAGICGKVGFLI